MMCFLSLAVLFKNCHYSNNLIKINKVMETNEKVRMSSQLIALLPCVAVKLLSFMLMFQSNPKGVFLYEHRFARMLKITDEEVRLAVQTLINLKLIDLTNIDGKFRVEFNKDQFDKYFKVDIQKVLDHVGYQLATEVTYNKEVEAPKQKDITDMSDAELRTLLLRVQASINERQQLKEKVVNLQSNNDDLGLSF